jgi:general L-amino acid transport system permease protein
MAPPSDAAATTVHAATPSRERPPAHLVGPLAWLRANLFRNWLSTATTLALGYLIIRFVLSLIDWGVINAIWSVPTLANGNADPAACRAVQGVGACWAAVADKWRFTLFGRYPYAEQWRPAICIALFLGLYVVSAMRRFWRKELVYIWAGTLALIFLLMWGGVAGLKYVPQDEWGGLPITLILATFGLACAFPLAVLVALGRRSTELPAVKMLCVLYVELIRGVPLVALLFMVSVMLPLFLPTGTNIDKLLRAQIAIILFVGAYVAEVVRGGLQALPKGQAEAADALGLTYWQKQFKIILPQALRLVIPPLVNTFIGFFKDTSLVVIIGIFDLLLSGKTAMSDPIWNGASTEIYAFVAVIYFAFCYAMSSYSRNLEAKLGRSRNR